MPRKQTADCKTAAREIASNTGFARLAQQISGWTSRIVISLIVIVAGIGFGRQVLLWWSESSHASLQSIPHIAGTASPFQPQILQFGNQPWTIQTKAVAGDKRAVVTALREACRKVADSPDAQAVEPGEQEKALLASLSGESPLEEKPGKWQLYATDEVFPMVVGTRRTGLTPPPPSKNLAETGFSVLTWGIAVPSGANAWMLYTFQPKPKANGTSLQFAEIPIPPGGRSTLALQSPDGGALAAIEGEGNLANWKRFYEQYFVTHGWKRSSDWRGSDQSAQARFESVASAKTETVDVRIGYGRSGRLSGILTLTPSTNEDRSRERP